MMNAAEGISSMIPISTAGVERDLRGESSSLMPSIQVRIIRTSSADEIIGTMIFALPSAEARSSARSWVLIISRNEG